MLNPRASSPSARRTTSSPCTAAACSRRRRPKAPSTASPPASFATSPAPPSLEWEERRLGRYDLFVADECFLTGTGAEIIPVVSLDGRHIGTGTPGPITRRMSAAFHELAAHEGEPLF